MGGSRSFWHDIIVLILGSRSFAKMALSAKRACKLLLTSAALLYCRWHPLLAFAGIAVTRCSQPVPVRGSSSAVVLHAYEPASVADAWANHLDAFNEQDLQKIMLDYDETSRVTIYNNADGSKVVYKGLAEIQHMFEELFDGLSDLSTLEAPVIAVDDLYGGGGTVFLVWKCPGCGFETAADTFIFGPDKKVKIQNIVVTEYMVNRNPSCHND